MERLLIAVVVVVLAAVVALLIERRRPNPPTQATWAVPRQLDRADFDQPHAPWLVVVFSSSTCDACADTVAKAQVLASDQVAVEEVEATARRELHRRYAIEAVPLVVIADDEGVVRASFVGPPSATDLWAALAEIRNPGSTPEPHLGSDPTQEPPA